MAQLDYLSRIPKIFFKKRALPEQVTFFVTPKCNARCKHCFAWESLNDTKEKILSLEEINKISAGIGHFTYLLIGGGEPFLREDLAEIVRLFYKNCNVLNIAISTNGSFPDTVVGVIRDIFKDFKNSLTINVSFDDIGEDHDRIRQVPGIFDKAKETYLRLKELKREYPGLNAGIIMTCSPYNHKSLVNTYTWLRDNLKPCSIVLNYMRGNVKEKISLPQVDLSAYDRVMSMIEKDNLSGLIPGHGNFFLSDFNLASKMLMRRMVIDTVRSNSFQSMCFAGVLNSVLWYNGDVYPCEMLDKKMGSLRENGYDFKKIWRSAEAENIRRFIRNTRCFCTEECNINMNILFNPWHFPKLAAKLSRIKASRIIQRFK